MSCCRVSRRHGIYINTLSKRERQKRPDAIKLRVSDLLSGGDLSRKKQLEILTLSIRECDAIKLRVKYRYFAKKHPSSCPLDTLKGGPRALDIQSIVFPEREAKLTSLLTFLRIECKGQMNTN